MNSLSYLHRSIGMTIIAALCFGAQLLNGQSGSERIIVPLSDPSRLPVIKIEVVNGGITVLGNDQTNIIVEAHVRSNDPTGTGHLTPDDLSVKEDDNNEVKITSYTMKRQIDLTILVPRHTSLDLSAVNNGAITVTDVDGEIAANNVNGSVTLRNISGNAIAHSLNAQVLVTFRSVNPENPMAFSSMNGTVDVTFPGDMRANLSLQSGHGKVYSDFNIQLDAGTSQPITEDSTGGPARYRVNAERTIHGTINGGGPELQFRNVNGSIYIRKAPA